MLRRRENLRIIRRGGHFTLAILLAIAPTISIAQDRWSADGSRAATVSERSPAATFITADWQVPQFETSSVIAAVLCFAVGFGACLLLVLNMLPVLVRAQCIEIVREYLDLVQRESDIRVLVVNRANEALRKPRRASAFVAETSVESKHDSQQHLRVDRPTAPADSAGSTSDAAPNAMLSQIYEQNLHLRDQLRKQSRSVKQ